MIHLISLGAGVQSSTMALMAKHGEITPMPAGAIFADTQDEPSSVYRWLEWLEKELPFPVHRVTRGSLREGLLKLHTRADGKGFSTFHCIPAFTLNDGGDKGMAPRQCTHNYKVLPLDRAARKLGNVSRGEKEVKVCLWMGISLDETYRMKTPRHAWQSFRYPLVDLRMKRGDCLRWMERNAYPKPPRSACYYCPYHSDREWRELRDNQPEEFAKAVRFEKDYQAIRSKVKGIDAESYLHASRIPLDQVDFSTDVERGQMTMFGNDCEGLCGV